MKLKKDVKKWWGIKENRYIAPLTTLGHSDNLLGSEERGGFEQKMMSGG